MVSADSYAQTISTIYFTVYIIVFLVASLYCAYEVEEEHGLITKKTCNKPNESSKKGSNDTEHQLDLALSLSVTDAETEDEPKISDIPMPCMKRWKKFTTYWAKSLWAKKKIYISIIPHIFDQATDLGVMYIYYDIWKHPETYEWEHDRINMAIVFRTSVGVIVLHKIVSCGAIYALTRSLWDVFLQFIDFMMLKAIYLNYKLHTEEPGNAQRYLQILEGTFESGPQILISLLFITKTYNPDTPPDPIILISAISSIWTLTSRVVSDDKLLLKDEWKSAFLEGNKFLWINHLNWRYVVRVLCWRFCEISSRVFILVLLWVAVGGFSLAIILTVELCACFILCFLGEGVIVLGNMLYYTMAAVHKVPYLVLESAATYKVASPFIFLTLITIFCTEPFEAPKVDDFAVRNEVTYVPFKLFMLIYSWIASVIWVSSVIYIVLKGRSKQSSSRECDVLLLNKQWTELLNLIEFGTPPHKIYPTIQMDRNGTITHVDIFVFITRLSNFFAPKQKALVFANLYERDTTVEIEQKALSMAASDNLYLTKYLIETVGMKYSNELLSSAIHNNQLSIVKYLIITRHLDIDDPDQCAAYLLRHEQYGVLAHCIKNDHVFARYCLKWATMYLHIGVVKYLVEKMNMDVNHVDEQGESCLFWTVCSKVVIRDAPDFGGHEPKEYFEMLDGRQADRERQKQGVTLKTHLLDYFVVERKINWIHVNDKRQTALQVEMPESLYLAKQYFRKLHAVKYKKGYSAHDLMTLWGLKEWIPNMEEKNVMDTAKWKDLITEPFDLAIEIFESHDIEPHHIDNRKKKDNEEDENEDEDDDWSQLNKRVVFTEKCEKWMSVKDHEDFLFEFLFLSI